MKFRFFERRKAIYKNNCVQVTETLGFIFTSLLRKQCPTNIYESTALFAQEYPQRIIPTHNNDKLLYAVQGFIFLSHL